MINRTEITEIDKLFDKIKYNKVKPVQDGIIDVDQYSKAKFRILWILKEANSKDFGGWDLRSFIANDLLGYHNWRRTYNLITYITWGIFNDFPKWQKQSRKWEAEHSTILQKIAIINLKKIPGASSSSDSAIISEFQNNKEIIFKQVEASNPDIIIFGGTKKYLNQNDFNKIKDNNKRIVVSAFHPNTRKSHQVYYENVINHIKDALKQLLKLL